MQFAMRPIFFCLLAGILGSFSASSPAAESIAPARIREIAAMLPAQPAGFGQPLANRAAWENLAARHAELSKLIPRAVKLAAQPLPEQPDSLFLEFSKNGNRTRWQNVASARRERVQIHPRHGIQRQ